MAGWSNYSSGPAVACRTRVPPSLLLDQLGPAADSSIRLAWRWTCGARASSLPITVQWQPLSAELGAEPMSVVLPAGTVSHVLTGLPASTKFAVTVAAAAADGSMGSHHGSGTVTCSTAAAGAIYEIVYRVSELTDGVDFLPNHNAGDLIGEAAFLSDSGNFALPPSELATDACATALNKTHCTPGSSSCMDCAAAVWATGTGPAANAVRAQCSDPGREFPLDNKVHADKPKPQTLSDLTSHEPASPHAYPPARFLLHPAPPCELTGTYPGTHPLPPLPGHQGGRVVVRQRILVLRLDGNATVRVLRRASAGARDGRTARRTRWGRGVHAIPLVQRARGRRCPQR